MQMRRNVTPTDLYISSAFLLFSEFLDHVTLSVEVLEVSGSHIKPGVSIWFPRSLIIIWSALKLDETEP